MALNKLCLTILLFLMFSLNSMAGKVVDKKSFVEATKTCSLLALQYGLEHFVKRSDQEAFLKRYKDVIKECRRVRYKSNNVCQKYKTKICNDIKQEKDLKALIQTSSLRAYGFKNLSTATKDLDKFESKTDLKAYLSTRKSDYKKKPKRCIEQGRVYLVSEFKKILASIVNTLGVNESRKKDTPIKNKADLIELVTLFKSDVASKEADEIIPLCAEFSGKSARDIVNISCKNKFMKKHSPACTGKGLTTRSVDLETIPGQGQECFKVIHTFYLTKLMYKKRTVNKYYKKMMRDYGICEEASFSTGSFCKRKSLKICSSVVDKYDLDISLKSFISTLPYTVLKSKSNASYSFSIKKTKKSSDCYEQIKTIARNKVVDSIMDKIKNFNLKEVKTNLEGLPKSLSDGLNETVLMHVKSCSQKYNKSPKYYLNKLCKEKFMKKIKYGVSSFCKQKQF